MDEFLNENANLYRLIKEYTEHKSLCIGVDFDNTLYDFHKTGASYEMVRQLVRDLKDINCTIIIWTANKDLKFVEQFCILNDIPFDGINVDGIDLGWKSRKPFFNALIDDRAGLIQVYKELTRIVQTIKAIRN